MKSSTIDLVEEEPLRKRSFGKWALTAGGLAFFGVAIVGVWLPGIPTTGPLILSSMFLGKANPELRERILAIGVLAPYRGYIDGSRPFTRALRGWALLCMWISILLSCGMICVTAGRGSIAIPMCLIGGLIGSFVILVYQPKGDTPSLPNETQVSARSGEPKFYWQPNIFLHSHVWYH